ncbi:unnamed protein product, partial [Rotaria magnacalcarata]
RTDHIYCSTSDEQLCTRQQEEDFDSVTHLYICSEIKDNYLNYFPNVNQLTITLSCDWNDSTLTNLNHLIRLLCFTSNLHTLQFSTFGFYNNNLDLDRQSYAFEYVSKRNQIKSLILHSRCSLHELQFMVNLIQFLLSKTNYKTQHLFYLCIANTPKVCVKEINVMMKSENGGEHLVI